MKRRIRKIETEIYQLSNLDLPPTFGDPMDVPDDLYLRYQEATRLMAGIQAELKVIKEQYEKRL